MRITLALAVLLALTAAPIARAHDGEKHGGAAHARLPTTGSIASIDGDKLLLDSSGAKLTVTLTAKTTISRGLQPTDRSALRPGTLISVTGTKLSSGELVARAISIETTADDGPSKKTPAR